jgi:hypothetical protein
MLLQMSKVKQIEAAMQQLTPDELREVHDWLENFMEDQLEMTDEFKAGIEESKKLFQAGVKSRVRQP